MGKTIYPHFVGKIGYSHLHEPDTFRGATRYIMDFYPDDFKAVQATGCQLRLDRATQSFIRPRRDVKKTIKGEVVEFGPPRVVDKDGNPFTGYVGKGSTVEITLSIYDSGSAEYGKGHRLEEVKVLEHVEWEKKEATEEEKEVAPEIVQTPKKKLPF